MKLAKSESFILSYLKWDLHQKLIICRVVCMECLP